MKPTRAKPVPASKLIEYIRRTLEVRGEIPLVELRDELRQTFLNGHAESSVEPRVNRLVKECKEFETRKTYNRIYVRMRGTEPQG